ncbi:hypothetical protein [Cellulomonas triticagri]|uniref:hypothetical protein n=1 Tax=Cellulomonas triticagri TaxID=2483352 RepID=UPI0011C492F4|nr:hypothetical protein [Cellulomonas triticagri]
MRIWTVVATTALAALTAAPAVAAPVDPVVRLVEGTTSTASVPVPYPGRSTAFDLTAIPRSGDPVELALLVDGGGSPLADGPHALRLELHDAAGALVAAGTAAELGAVPVDLGVLHGTPLTLTGTATLPVAAGDDLQGVGMPLRLTLVASQDPLDAQDGAVGSDPVPGLARTGARGPLAALVVAALTGALGLRLRAVRHRPTEESA